MTVQTAGILATLETREPFGTGETCARWTGCLVIIKPAHRYGRLKQSS